MSKGTPNKSAFIRSLPADMPAADAVKAAAAKGIKLTENYVSTIRYNANKAAAKKGGEPSAASVAPAKRGPGRPRKVVSTSNGSARGGIEAEIERIVDAENCGRR